MTSYSSSLLPIPVTVGTYKVETVEACPEFLGDMLPGQGIAMSVIFGRASLAATSTLKSTSMTVVL